MSETIAVYGTLRKGCYNNRILGRKSKLICKKRIKGFEMFYKNGKDYPVAMKSSKDNSIVVEVYEVPYKIADHIDMLEVQYGYSAIRIKLKHNDKIIKPIIYIFDFKKIKKGDWIEFIKSQKV